jgi:hypothetical protein
MGPQSDDSEESLDEQTTPGLLRFVFPVVDSQKHVQAVEIVQDDYGDRAIGEEWESLDITKVGNIAAKISGKWINSRRWKLTPHRSDLGEESGQFAASLAAVAADLRVTLCLACHSDII